MVLRNGFPAGATITDNTYYSVDGM